MKKEIKLSKLDYSEWKKFREGSGSVISHNEYILLCEMHSKYFEHKMYRPSKCCGQKTLNKWISELNIIYQKGL
tara:strand:- start:3197 stop:3418 length:222 start_codon:yes stop_codon:yes gene_type:complete